MHYRIDKDESRRYEAMKALMCVFVMMIHAFSDDFTAQPTCSRQMMFNATLVISRIICDCAVPMFVLMSAVLLYAKPINWWKNLKKKARSLLIPYFIFNSLWIVWMFCKHIFGKRLGITAGDDIDFSTYSPLQWLDAYLGMIYSAKPILTVLWYVRDLFVLNILAIPLKKLVDLLPIPVLILTLAVWIFDVPMIIISPYSLCFFIFGYYLVKYDIHFRSFEKLNRYAVWLIYLVLLAVDAVLLRRSLIVNRLFIVASVVFFIRFSAVLTKGGKLLDWIAPCSFFLYLTHRFTYALFQAVTGHSFAVYMVSYILKPVLTLAVIVPLFYFMRRFLPGLLSLMVGGRIQKK